MGRGCRTGLNHLNTRLARLDPGIALEQLQQRQTQLTQRLHLALEQQLELKRRQWRNVSNLLHAVSPLNTLERGYAIVTAQEDRILRRAADCAPGDTVTARLSDGSLQCTVKNIILPD